MLTAWASVAYSMEITVILRKGPLEAEFTGEDREELQTELLEFKEFLENNAGAFEGISPADENDEPKQIQLNESVSQTGDPKEQAIHKALAPVARATGISEEELAGHLYVDPDGEEDPEILIDDPDETFNTTKTGKQKPASLILLYLWDKCYDDKEEVKSSELKDALTGSGIDPSNIFNIYDKDINQKGPSNRILKLSRSGQLQAQEEIEQLITDEE